MKKLIEKNVSIENINRYLLELARFGAVGESLEDGISRIAFSDEETQALRYVEAEARKLSLTTRYDVIGNLYVCLPGESDEVVQAGSHIDSVPKGGAFDGTLGIVCGLEAIAAIQKAGVPLKKGLELACWRGEEHTYNAVYKGSAAAFGVSDPRILSHKYQNRTLAEAIRSQGLDPAPIETGQPTLSRKEIDAITAHLELHIEQDDKLEKAGLDIGIVNRISGHRRILTTVTGRFDHSGATDFGVEHRSDANLAVAVMQVRLNNLAVNYRLTNKDFTQTVGIVNTDPQLNKMYPQIQQNSVTKISGFSYFTFDLMGVNNQFLDDYLKAVKEVIRTAARDMRVEATTIDLDYSLALEDVPTELKNVIESSCRDFNYRYQFMPSGAGHDSALIGQQRNTRGDLIPTALIFVPCREGISHSPAEYCYPDQMLKGTHILTSAMIGLAAV